ncbi:hypothetical protein [Kouleothrix sp.]|uniref:hypothetical protein n=1 Tax=Kouleothrix sp. TaxID=2779161 RepID=UPI00391B4A66
MEELRRHQAAVEVALVDQVAGETQPGGDIARRRLDAQQVCLGLRGGGAQQRVGGLLVGCDLLQQRVVLQDAAAARNREAGGGVHARVARAEHYLEWSRDQRGEQQPHGGQRECLPARRKPGARALWLRGLPACPSQRPPPHSEAGHSA